METRRLMCYYARYKSESDKLMLDEFVDYCDQVASKEVFLSSMPKFTRKICQRKECGDKTKADLNIKKRDREQKLATDKKIKELRSSGLTDVEIWQRWEEFC